MAKDKVWYRYVGEVPGELATGRPIEPGEYVELSGDEVNDVFNAEMIYDGRLIEAEEKHVQAARKSQRDEEKVQEADIKEQGEEEK